MTKLITPGELAPDFELDDVQGNRIRLSDFRGKPVATGLPARLYVTVLPRAVGAPAG